MGFAIFVLLAIVGGFALPVIYGVRLGLAPHESIVLCLAVFTFLSYATICLLYHLESYASARRYLKTLRRHFRPVYRLLKGYAGRSGVLGILALSTFLAGWWLAVLLAFIAEIEIPQAMIGILAGLVSGGLLAWGLYLGIVRVVSSPILLAIAFISIGLGIGVAMQILVAKKRMNKRVRAGASQV
jgi:hypothetical protein